MLIFDKNTFEKNQRILLKIANSKFWNWILGTNRLPEALKGKKIIKIAPASIHYLDGNLYKVACFTRPRFAEALAFNLSPIAVFYNRERKIVRFSPVGLGFGALFAYFGGFGIIGTAYYAGAGDGYIDGKMSTMNQTNWDKVHDSDGDGSDGETIVVNYTDTENLSIGCGDGSVGGEVRIWRTFFPIDTSGLSDSATIISASMYLYVYGTSNGDNDGKDYVALVQTSQASPTSLVAADYNNCGDAINNPTKGSSNYDISSISTSAYLQIALNATGIGWISKTSYTLLGAREGHDIEDELYAGSHNTFNAINCRPSEYTGTSNDPYLDISVEATYLKTTQAKARIEQTLAKTIQAKARVERTELKTVQAKASILGGINLKTIQSKARIEQTLAKTIQAKARVERTELKTVQARGSVEKQGILATIRAKANIWAFRAGFVQMRSYDQSYPQTMQDDRILE